MDPSVAIRPLDKVDIPAVAELLRVLSEKFIVHEFSESGRQQFLFNNSCVAIERFVSDGFRYHVAATRGEDIVGFVGIRDNRHLYHLFVAEPFQRRAIGRRLWEVARDECRSTGHTGPFTVNSSSHAVPVYERFGFRRTAPVQDHGGVDSVSSDGRTLRLIVPYDFGLYCGQTSSLITVSMLPVDSAVAAMASYGGYAYRDSALGTYTVVASSSSQTPVTSHDATLCTGNSGSDAQIKTMSVNGRTGSVLDLLPLTTTIKVGQPVFLWQKVTYQFKASTTFPGSIALWRKVGGTDQELLAPFDTTARFNYYTSGSETVATSVPAATDIRGVQLVLNALSPTATSGGSKATANIVTSVFFKNVQSY